MRLFVAVTDNDWFRFLRAQPGIDEVNFWKPRGQLGFRALSPGEPLLFKLHSPENYIVGGGFYLHFTFLPYTLAWETFQEKNGAATLDEMRRRIERYRHEPVDLNSPIGCILLRDPFFFPDDLWIPSPPEFARNIVQGKNFETDSETGRRLWEEVIARRMAVTPAADLAAAPLPMFGDPRLYRPRLGQGTFRVLVTDSYQRRCAVTGEKALPVLDAAHIRPVAEGGQHRLDNGLLLHTDVHRLYDKSTSPSPPTAASSSAAASRPTSTTASPTCPSRPEDLDAGRPDQPAGPGGAGVALGGSVFKMRTGYTSVLLCIYSIAAYSSMCTEKRRSSGSYSESNCHDRNV